LWEEVALHELLGATTWPWVYAGGGSGLNYPPDRRWQ
jgi:hypothetical protein